MFHHLMLACMMSSGPTEKVAEAGSQAVDTLTQTALGALLVLLAIACGLLGWLVIKAKNAHLADKDVMREELLKHAIQSRELAAENARAYEQFAEAARRSEDRAEDVLTELEAVTKRVSKIDATCDNRCAAAEKTGEKVDALAISIPGLDRDKYLLATKGGK